MECRCGEQMELIERFDTGSSGYTEKEISYNIAFNLYLCFECGRVCREDVWDGAGKTWLTGVL